MVYVTDQPNSGGYTVVPFDLNNDLYGENAHKATSIHPQLSVRNLVNSLGNDATIFVRNENRFNEIAGVLSDNPPTLLANIKSVDGIVSQSGTESQAQKSAAMPASALETDEAYFSVAEKYRDGTATEAETEQMLLHSDILSELYKQNASLAQKVQIKVSEFFAKLRQNIGNGARSKEAAWMADAIDELLPGYNVQIAVCDEFIAEYGVYPYASDCDCFQPLMERFTQRYGFYPKYPVADAAYGSFNNYLYCEQHGMEKYMKT